MQVDIDAFSFFGQKYENMAEADKKRSADEREQNPEKSNKISEPRVSFKKEKGMTVNFPHKLICMAVIMRGFTSIQ